MGSDGVNLDMIKKYDSGLRVEGLYSHKGKRGTVIDSNETFTTLIWDNGKNVSTVQTHKIRPLAVRQPQPTNLITKCQAPDYTQYSEAYIKRNPQLFCVTCQRWQFKRRRCVLFVGGKQK
jgi:hypothetical protein